MRTLKSLATAALLLAMTDEASAGMPMKMCPMIYQPVCAVAHSGRMRTFSNRCTARNARAHVLYLGRCGGGRHR
jgi:hypothetical protein